MKESLREQVQNAVDELGLRIGSPVSFEIPRQAGHGDVTTNVAMILAKKVKRPPRQLATDIVNHLHLDSSLVEKVEVAGPGFINFTLTARFYCSELGRILENDLEFGRSVSGRGKKAQVEFVSANPTGPLTVGHGRNAVFGDTVANLLAWVGYAVEREYYFNNAGRQMRMLGDSVRLRYLELLGEPQEFPADYYQGGYIRDIAAGLRSEFGDRLRDASAEGKFKERAENVIFEDIRKTLLLLGIRFDSFFNEDSLYSQGKVAEVLEEFRAKAMAYDKDGAVWLRTEQLGSEKDKVIVKSSGEPTYRLPDIAYHREKFRRGYDLMVDVLGSDHIATYPDVLAGVKALGYDADRVKVLIHQFVTIMQNGEVVKMSTRKANFITLDELIAEVGADVVRYFFLMRSHTSHLNFDLDLARKQSDENPVYYLQYAHARISSIIKYAEESGHAGLNANLDRLQATGELELIKLLLQFPDVVESCALTFEPHRLAEYLQTVASSFHKFYHDFRVVGDDEEQTKARLALCRAIWTVLRNGFRILGITAPERM